MRWEATAPKGRDHLLSWHAWFAWFPVTTVSGKRVWLESVRRRAIHLCRCDDDPDDKWEYEVLS